MIQDDFAGIYKTISEADGIVWISAVYWSEMTECFKAFFDRLRRCDAAHNHFLAQKRCILAACAGGTGEMRTYDRISVVRYNKDYILSAMYEAGRTYADRLETGFDMYY